MSVKDTFFYKKEYINIQGELVDISKPCLMGIINITPDSFYPGSRFSDEHSILKKTEQMLSEGAKFIDIGAYSSRPGADYINENEEKERLRPALSIIRKHFPDCFLSLDTFRASIAEWAVCEFNVSIINDISGGTLDEAMFSTIARLKIPYVLMHMRGNPQNMQSHTNYSNVTKEVMYEIALKILKLQEIGINDIIIDPGFGFAKNLNQNYELLNNLYLFKIFELPIMAGVSRKSMLYKLLNITPEEALNSTTVLHTIALLNGVNILRVHDVKEATEAIKIVDKLIESAKEC